MSAGVFGNRFYGHRYAAWHRLGLVTENGMTAVEVLSALGGGYWFDKRPIYVEINGKIQSLSDFALVRSPVADDPQERSFGYATKQYHIIQPLRICELFDENVKQPVETMGMLGLGEKLFVTWKMPSIDIKGDAIDVYGFIACGYDAKSGASLNVVTTRVVCQNTWNAAMEEVKGEKVDGRGRIWTGRHNSPRIERDLAIWLSHVQTEAEQRAEMTKNLFVRMAEKDMNKDVANELLLDIYPNPDAIPVYFPEALKTEKQEQIDKGTQDAQDDRDAVMSLFSGEGTAIDATAWGLFNACTEYENWGRTTRKPPEYSILFGNRSMAMNRAAETIGRWIDNN